MQRRIVPFNAPLSPLQGGKAGNKDPRNFVSGGGVDTEQWDMMQQSMDRASLALAQPPQYSEAQSAYGGVDSVAQVIATRITFIPQTVIAPGINMPIIIVRKNVNRLGLIICNGTQDSVGISFGPFPYASTGSAYGMIVPPANNLQFLGAAVPIDDIYIVNNTTAGRLMVAYEGIAAAEANP